MNFSNWLWLWTAIMPLAVILYYFFRKKYKDRQISSLLFWEEMMKEIQASPYLKKLQHHLLFYLQLAALVLCVLALMGPYLEDEGLEGNEFIFVVDTSATMLAGSPSQFELQQEKMRELAEEAGGKPVTIVTAGASPEVLARNERETEKLLETIDGLEVDYGNEEMEQALLYAESLAGDESAVIHVFTDALDRGRLAGKSGRAYVIHGMERPLANASVLQFGLAEGEGGLRAIVQAANHGTEKLTGEIVITSDSGTRQQKPVVLDAEAEIVVPFEGLADGNVWRAELQIGDDYKADNEMSAILQQPVDQIFLDAALHELVSSGFGALGMETVLMESDAIGKRTGAPIATNQTDLLANPAPVLLLGRNDATPVEASGEIEWKDHPLLAYAPLDGVFVSQLYPGFDGYETLASIGGQPFIQLSPEGDIAVLADIQSTDWPLNPSFPLFLWSAVQSLSQSGDFLGFFQPNEYRSVALASDSGEWEIFKEDAYRSSYLEGQGAFKAPAEPGVYDVVGEDEAMKLIVRLSNEEKMLAAGTSYRIGEATEKAETVRHYVMPWLIVVILLLLIAEWEVYRRGIARR
ncbi:vWA domain-containing protein [Planococcus sp. FY231025]|uniref:vWA domain-containing protein n=1 Tax=Planococcus sp. FY231025 TaxID=3455699 RepID=UPI003F8FBABD